MDIRIYLKPSWKPLLKEFKYSDTFPWSLKGGYQQFEIQSLTDPKIT